MVIKACVPLMLLLTAAACLAVDEKPFSPDEMVDRMITAPGQYEQMCSTPPELKPGIPLPLYGDVFYSEMYISKENIAALRAHRTGAVGVLLLRLAAMDVTKPMAPMGTPTYAGEDQVTRSGVDPHAFSGLFMQIIMGTDAVETLPELLRIESQYHGLIVAAQVDPQFKLPAIFIDGSYYAPSGKNQLSPRDTEILPFQVMQRQMLSLIMQLLRRQHFQPLLDSDLEKKYAKVIKARAKGKDLRDIKTPEDAKAKKEPGVQFDPIYNVPLGYIEDEDYPTVDFNAKVRDQIRGLAEQFIETVPRDQWKVNAD